AGACPAWRCSNRSSSFRSSHRRGAMYGQYQTTPTAARDGDSAQARIDSARRQIITGEAGATPVPVTPSGTAPIGGGITWGAPTAVAVAAGPASTTLIAANA